MADGPPCHLLGASSDRRTLCGLDARTTHPRMLARHLPAHRAGHASVGRIKLVCADCEQVDRTDNPRRYL